MRARHAASAVAVAIVLLAGYWLSPLHHPGVPTDDMLATANTIDTALQVNLYQSSNEGSDQSFQDVARQHDGVAVLDVRQHHDSGQRTVEADVVIWGAVPKAGSLINWGPGVGVQACFRYSYTGPLHTMRHFVIPCPAGIPPPAEPNARTAALGQKQVAPESIAEQYLRLDQLVDTIRRKDQRPSTSIGRPSTAELADLLRRAEVDPALPRSLAVKSGVAVLALGTLHNCVLGTQDAHSLTLWPAPWEAPCTTDRAFANYAMGTWPPLPGT